MLIRPEDQERFHSLSESVSWLYFGIGGVLCAAIGISGLKRLSDALMGRIHRNYRFVMGFNGTLIALGALGWITPAASAFLHNSSTILLSMNCLTALLEKESAIMDDNTLSSERNYR